MLNLQQYDVNGLTTTIPLRQHRLSPVTWMHLRRLSGHNNTINGDQTRRLKISPLYTFSDPMEKWQRDGDDDAQQLR